MIRSQIVRTVVFIAILSMFAAEFSVGCGQGYVYGPVDQKFVGGGNNEVERLISINGTTYLVPPTFYNEIRVGDTVKYDGKSWSVVKRAGQPGPAPAVPVLPPP